MSLVFNNLVSFVFGWADIGKVFLKNFFIGAVEFGGEEKRGHSGGEGILERRV